MIDRLQYFGITHQTAPIDVRERCFLDEAKSRHIHHVLHDVAEGCFLLQTCGRLEIYVDSAADCTAHIRKVLPIDDHGEVKTGRAVAEHMIRVAAGLESQIIGEPQVLGQIKTSYTDALDAQSLSPLLTTLIRHAIHAGKQARQAMTLADTSPTLAEMVVAHMAQSTGTISRQRVLIVGCGHLAQDIAAHVAANRPAQLTIANRHMGRALALANKTNAIAATTDNLGQRLFDHDVAIVCTAALRHIITPDMIAADATRPLSILDLAMPRNVDPAIAAMPTIDLTHLDQLTAGRSIHDKHRRQIDTIIAQTLDRLHQWTTGRRVAQTINRWLASADHPDPQVRRRRRRRLHKPIMMLKKAIAA